MDDVAFCVQKDVPIVSGVGVREEEGVALSDRGGSLRLQHTGHMTPTVFPAACNSGPTSQGLELALERGNQRKLLTTAVGSEIVYDYLNFPKIVFLAPRFQSSRKPRSKGRRP